MTKCNCKCVLMEGKLNGNILPPFKPNKRMQNYNNFYYASLDEALQKIYDFEVNTKNTLWPHITIMILCLDY